MNISRYTHKIHEYWEYMYERALSLKKPKKSFFLWGQRQTGKSSLLIETFKNAEFINLLKSDLFLDYSTRPSLLRERLAHLKKMTS